VIVAVVIVLAALVTIVAVLRARSGDSDSTPPAVGLQDPSAALQEILGLSASGQFGRHYDRLHPAQQAIISRDDYIDCANRVRIGKPQLGRVEIEVTDTYSDTVRVPGTDQRADATALVVNMRAEDQQETMTMYLALVDSAWRLIDPLLTREQLAKSCGFVIPSTFPTIPPLPGY
jgi:hypothetical protein